MEEEQVKTVLVIGNKEDSSLWRKLFQEFEAERKTRVFVGEWADILLTAYPSNDRGKRLQCTSNEGTFFVDFVLIRKLVRGLNAHCDDHRQKLFAMMAANVPSVNSLESVYGCLDRLPCHFELLKIRDRVGHKEFPLIDIHYYSNYRTMRFFPPCPMVIKVGHAEAGYGKMLFEDEKHIKDFAGVLALHGDYATAEPFMDKDYDLRIQKIGKHYRAYKRESSNWKTNVGSSILTEIDMEARWRKWADLASGAFGGLDILTVDVMHKELDKGAFEETILEINDTASGLYDGNKEGDMRDIVEVCMDKMKQEFDARVIQRRKLESIGQGNKNLKE